MLKKLQRELFPGARLLGAADISLPPQSLAEAVWRYRSLVLKLWVMDQAAPGCGGGMGGKDRAAKQTRSRI